MDVRIESNMLERFISWNKTEQKRSSHKKKVTSIGGLPDMKTHQNANKIIKHILASVERNTIFSSFTKLKSSSGI